MTEYICLSCGEKCYSAAEIKHMVDPTCEKCGGKLEKSSVNNIDELIKRLPHATGADRYLGLLQQAADALNSQQDHIIELTAINDALSKSFKPITIERGD